MLSIMNCHLTGLIGLLLIGSNALLTAGDETLPNLENEYWGPGEQPSRIDESIKPFKIIFDKQMVDDLKIRLNITRKLQPPLENVSWSYGVNSEFIPSVVDYWQNKYDFQKREEHLNQYPQFLTNIQGLDIHFIHVKPLLPNESKVEVLPLYLQHGWPGSVVEFYEAIPLLTTVRADQDFVFEVIVPSLPGYGYSSAPARPGLGPVEIAQIMKNLMLRLGFTKWYTQGGDWGGMIVANMAVMYPEHILGTHSNLCIALNPKALAKLAWKNALHFIFSEESRKNLTQSIKTTLIDALQESGFFHIQATKPETIGVALSDSPAGLAAYILEKFVKSTRNEKHGNGDEKIMLEKLTMDELLDNIMLYWAPNKATTSIRLYAEFASERNFKHKTGNAQVKVPSACAQFPYDVINIPEEILRDRFVNMVSFTKMPRGGHFAAMEEPQLLTDDIWAAIKKMRDQQRSAKKYDKFFISLDC